MEADSWEEVKFLKDTAGIPIEKALGLEDNSEDNPSPKTFKENLMVRGFGDIPLQFQLPDPKDIPLIGVPDAEDLDELAVFPPFIDLESLLEPIFIPASKVVTGNDSQDPSTSVDIPHTESSKDSLPAKQYPSSDEDSLNDETPPLSEVQMQTETLTATLQEGSNEKDAKLEAEPMEHSALPNVSLKEEDKSTLNTELVNVSSGSTSELITSSNNSDTSSSLSIIDLTQD